MTINRRTIVLGLPTLAGLMLTGCQGDEGTSPSGSATPQDGHASAQAAAGTSVSGAIYVSQTNGFTVGAFPTYGTNISPNNTLYQACFNKQELLVLLRDSAVVSGRTAARTIALKLLTGDGTDWAPNTTRTIDMASGSSNGSEGFIYHNPDYAATTPDSAKYAYQMSQGQIIVSTGSTLNLVTIEFSANLTQIRAVPVSSYSSNSATGYVLIPTYPNGNRTVTLNARKEDEATV